MEPSQKERLDIAANRRAVKYAPRELALRVAWSLAAPLFRFSPRPLWFWRNALLRLFGADIGPGVRVEPTARILMPWNLAVGGWSSIGPWTLVYDLGRVTLGERVTVSHRAHLCAGTHDHTRPDFPLLKPSVTIGSDAWICSEAFVGPGVTIGEGSIVAACAVAVADVPPWTIVGGNPAKKIGGRRIEVPDKDAVQ